MVKGIPGELAVSEVRRREGVPPTIYYIIDAGKGWMLGGTKVYRRRSRQGVPILPWPAVRNPLAETAENLYMFPVLQ